MGDIHFSQGDGEITFCGAIEMAGFIDIHVDVIKDGIRKYGVTNPILKPSPVEPHDAEYLVFEGISVDEHSGEQAYVILGTAPVEGRISGIVDTPNACCTIAVPTAVFDFDIMPNASGPKAAVPGGSNIAQAG